MKGGTALTMHLPVRAMTVLVLSSFFFHFGVMATTATGHHRHLLHQPFFPVTSAPPPGASPTYSSSSLSPTPSPSPLSRPAKYPFSAGTNSPPSPGTHNPFFPSSSSSPPPPPPPSPASLATFPANISSLVFPTGHSHARHVTRLVTLVASVLSAAFLLSLVAVFVVLIRRRQRKSASDADDRKSTTSDSRRLFDTAPSDGSHRHKQPPKYTSSNPSSEFLYLGTIAAPQSTAVHGAAAAAASAGVGMVGTSHSGSASTSEYQKPGSPELRPLPPLPKYNAFTPTNRSGEQLDRRDEKLEDGVEENDEFFSPRGSSANKDSASRVWSSSRRDFQGIGTDRFGSTSFNSRTASYPYSNSCSPAASITSTTGSSGTDQTSKSLKSKSPPLNRSPDPPTFSSPQGRDSCSAPKSFDRVPASVGQCKKYVPVKMPPPPPPLPPRRFWELSAGSKMSSLEKSSDETSVMPGEKRSEVIEKTDEAPKPKLKPLHWDKVRASSSRVMVWDQIKSNTFQLNEEMIETLFRVNSPSLASKDHARRQGVQLLSPENWVLEPKKSQNIAILLRALNVTTDEVCEALMEGNSDTLGSELLECLLKMAPTLEEEQKLKEFKDDSPFKLGPAEKLLKAVLDIPFAFKRVDAMLYVVNFDLEAQHLRRSFDTIAAACEELKNARMFLKLLEAVLKTGNRMNVGTNRGDARAFKLDTLLKLVDVKGMDGKTTLLHFVVQEIIKSEGSRLAAANQNSKNEDFKQSSIHEDIDHRKLGLQVVSGLSSELTSVKKAAAMDSDTLNNDVTKLAAGMTKVREVLNLNHCGTKFQESMSAFISKAQEEVTDIQARGNITFSAVREVTEYFHGNLAEEKAHPFRIFVVVRDFLSILDQVCKEVARVNERTMYRSTRPSPANPPVLPPVFPQLHTLPRSCSSDDETSPAL